MVRIAASFITAAVAFASLASAAPTRRQEAGGDLNTIGGDVPTGDPNGTAGGSVDIPSSTTVPSPPAYTPEVPPYTPEEPPSTPEEPPAPYTPPETPEAPPYNPEAPPYNPEAPPYTPETPPYTPPSHDSTPPAYPPDHQYGSGSMNWETQYDDCVQQCMEQYPAPPTVVTLPPHDSTPPPSEDGAYPPAENGGEPTPNAGTTGVTHDIMVEPIAGALHFGPGFVTAAVGDAIRFTFVNGEHSIVQSSVAFPCNATTGGFDSGVQKAGGSFTHVVDSTEPVFFYSSVGSDCQNGMFGAVNMATGAPDSTTTVSSLLPQWAAANPDLKAALDATNRLAAQTGGMTWGGKIETKDFPAELYPQLATSVLYTRGMIAGNPEMVSSEGVFKISGEVVIPNDISVLLATADRGGLPAPGPDAQADAETETPPAQNVAYAPGTNDGATGGAGSTVASRFLVGGVALLAALLAF